MIRRAALALSLALALAPLGCGAENCSPTACAPPEPAAIDATVRHSFASEAAFLAFSRIGPAGGAVKVVLPGWNGAGACRVDFLDPAFYALHDEWRIFRRLNGVDVPGCSDDALPRPGQTFATMADIYAYFDDHDPRAYGLQRLGGGRIYDCAFYERMIGSCAPAGPERYGALPDAGGILWYVPGGATPSGETIWALSLYRWAELHADEVLARVRAVEATLPIEKGALRWLANDVGAKAWQTPLGSKERAAGTELGGRVVFEAELVRADFAEGYTLGVTAGIPRRVEFAGATITDLGPDDIALLRALPDEVGPVAGIVSRTRQTPQAHLALLAESRGTPNAYAPGLFDDPALAARSAAGTPIALRVRSDGVDWLPLDPQQWAEWKQRSVGLPLSLTPIETEGIADVIPLDGRSLAAVRADIGRIGGKCAGMDFLRGIVGADDPALATPPDAACVSVRLYAALLAALPVDLDALVADTRLDDVVLRHLVLQGYADYAAAHHGLPSDLAKADKRIAALAADDPLLALIQAGGLVEILRKVDLLDPAHPLHGHWQGIAKALEARFASHTTAQALRFRSSSTAEDSAAFHGAGLYASYSGWLQPPDDERPAAEAVVRVLASYFRKSAWEERASAGIAHLDGRMGVLVHARFDDDKELANAVALLGVWQDDAGGLHTRLVINAQIGAVSVTNPIAGTEVLPEIVRIVDRGDGPAVAVLQRSTEISASARVVDDATAQLLSQRLRTIAQAWLSGLSEGLSAAERPHAALLDFELKHMATGWPQRHDGALNPERWILKQVRPLSRRQRVPDAAFAGFPLSEPERVAATAVRVVRCVAGPAAAPELEVSAHWLDWDRTDPLLGAGALLASDPWPSGQFFGTRLRLRSGGDVSETSSDATSAFVSTATPTLPAGAPLEIAAGDRHVRVEASGAWQVTSSGSGQQLASGDGAGCGIVEVAQSPSSWLETLFPAP